MKRLSEVGWGVFEVGSYMCVLEEVRKICGSGWWCNVCVCVCDGERVVNVVDTIAQLVG